MSWSIRSIAKITLAKFAGRRRQRENTSLIYTSMITYTNSENLVSEDETLRSDATYNTGEEPVTDAITTIYNSSINEAEIEFRI